MEGIEWRILIVKMCGVAGYINFKKNKKRNSLKIIKAMLNSIIHRGPDSTKFINTENYAFGTNRLAIQEINNGDQPIEDERYILGFNGEIFNYFDLKKNFRSEKINSEIKLILEMFKKYGVKFVEHLKGQFVIYIYDKKFEEVFIFRDRLGIRPLYYSLNKNSSEFLFASELKAILLVSKQEHRISHKAFAQTALFWTTIGNSSSFEKIFCLPSNSFMVIGKSLNINIQPYEDILISRNDKISPKKYYDKIQDSVKSQIFGEVGFCSYLSGGIDSSIIAYLLNSISKNKIDTFSISFDDESYDESSAQKLMSKFINSNHHTLKIKNEDIPNNFFKTIEHAETFIFRTAPVPMLLLSKLVSKKGHKVFFSGEGADEIFFGYDIFFETKIRKFWSKSPNSKNRFLLFKKLYKYLPQFSNSRYFSMIKDFYKTSLSIDDDLFYSHFVRWSQYEYMRNFFNLKDSRDYSQENLVEELLKNLPKDFISLNLQRRAQYLECKTLLSNYLLSSQGDRMSMANSLEGRYPFLDENLIRDTTSMSDRKLAPTINSKKYLRDIFNKIIPQKIVNREKIAYQAPEARCFFSQNRKKKEYDLTKKFLSSAKKIDILNYKNVTNLIEKIKDPLSSQRLGFRENMAFVLGMSFYCLEEFNKKYKNKIS